MTSPTQKSKANSHLPDLPQDWRCEECGQASEQSKILTAPNPFDPADTIFGCPNCKEVGSFRQVCQVKDCEDDATCGSPLFRGFRYAFLCGKHFGEAKKTGVDPV